MKNTTHKQPTRRALLAKVRRNCQRLAVVQSLADAAIDEIEATFATRPQHAAITAEVAFREIAAQLPKEIRRCRNRK